MDVITVLLFGVIFSIALIFSILSIELERGEWAFLGMVGWFSFAELVLVLADPTMYAFSYLFFGMGLIFLAVGFGYLFQSMEFKRKKKEQEEEWEIIEYA